MSITLVASPRSSRLHHNNNIIIYNTDCLRMRRNFLVFSVEINRKFTQNMDGTVYDSGIQEATVASLPAEM